jgi:hypothetical protein
MKQLCVLANLARMLDTVSDYDIVASRRSPARFPWMSTEHGHSNEAVVHLCKPGKDTRHYYDIVASRGRCLTMKTATPK